MLVTSTAGVVAPDAYAKVIGLAGVPRFIVMCWRRRHRSIPMLIVAGVASP